MSVVRYSGPRQINVTTLALPEPGAFNGAVGRGAAGGAYICVYRADERTFAACELASDLSFAAASHSTLSLPHGVDPRLVRHQGKLWVFFSVPVPDRSYECIHAAELQRTADGYACGPAFRITPPSLGRQKSWLPFDAGDALYCVSHINPHTVWRIEGLGNGPDPSLVKVAEEAWRPPEPWSEELRGNAPPLRLTTDAFLGTFHMSPLRNGVACYENGCYTFSAKPPFEVRSCSTSAYLESCDARAAHTRRRGEINGTFPLGLVRDDGDVLISFGDNDSAVRVLRTTEAALVAGMHRV
jgi:hypothetical protein